MTNDIREIPVSITSRHNDISDTIKADVNSQIQKLLKYNPNIMDAKIIIDRQNTSFKVDISLQVPGSFITGKNEDYDLTRALDTSIEKAKIQIKRLRDRMVDHKARPTSERFVIDEAIKVGDEEIDEEIDEYTENE